MEDMFSIDSFSGGVNEYVTEALVKLNESVNCKNCNIDNGSLRSKNVPSLVYSTNSTIHRILPFYQGTPNNYLFSTDGQIKNTNGENIYAISNPFIDTINFEYKGKKVLIGVSEDDTAFVISGDERRMLRNRRISYNDEGNIDGYIDNNGVKKEREEDTHTYAPRGKFIELHYDRLWIAGDKNNPDRVYFSTAGVNGADIDDWTAPIEEAEANQHGGFIDVRSYDGGEIIGLKVIFNNIVIFKNKTAYKIFGDNPSNYELVQLFSSSGAIADKSICVGNNGAYFLNNDGIYFYDGTNTNLISQKINKTISRMNSNYSKNSVGCYYNNKYYLAIPVDNSSTNNLLIEYDTTTNSFVTQEIGEITSFAEIDNKLYFSSADKIKSLTEGDTYLPLYWETPNYDFGYKNSRKNSNYIYFRGRGNGSVKFRVITEKKEKSLEIPLTSTETLYRKKLKNKGRMFKMIIENVNNSYIEIINPQLLSEIDLD